MLKTYHFRAWLSEERVARQSDGHAGQRVLIRASNWWHPEDSGLPTLQMRANGIRDNFKQRAYLKRCTCFHRHCDDRMRPRSFPKFYRSQHQGGHRRRARHVIASCTGGNDVIQHATRRPAHLAGRQRRCEHAGRGHQPPPRRCQVVGGPSCAREQWGWDWRAGRQALVLQPQQLGEAEARVEAEACPAPREVSGLLRCVPGVPRPDTTMQLAFLCRMADVCLEI